MFSFMISVTIRITGIIIIVKKPTLSVRTDSKTAIKFPSDEYHTVFPM